MWQLQNAKARFSEFLEAARTEGPQIVTRRGVEAAVLISIEEWRQLQNAAKPTLSEFLLNEGPRFEVEIPHRRALRMGRAPMGFE